MGGKAFATVVPPINVPRLTTIQYLKLRSILTQRLGALFTHVAVPIEAPGKLDYGDVDIIVSGPKNVLVQGNPGSVPPTLFAAGSTTIVPELSIKDAATQSGRINEQVNSVSALANPASPTAALASQEGAISDCVGSIAHVDYSYAVPVGRYVGADDGFIAGSCAQVDITVVERDMFDWHLFQHSHGDFFQLIGPSIRSLGLLISDSGFYAVHSSIEPHDKKRARVFLNSDPIKVLEFLRLDPHTFYGASRLADVYHVTQSTLSTGRNQDEVAAPLTPQSVSASKSQCTNSKNDTPDKDDTDRLSVFETEDQLFAYAASMRGFDPGLYVPRETMKRAERWRLQNRRSYRQFVTQYLPLHFPVVFGHQSAGEARGADGHEPRLSTSLSCPESAMYIPGSAEPAKAIPNGATSKSDGTLSPQVRTDRTIGPRRKQLVSVEEREAIRDEALQVFNKNAEWRDTAARWIAHLREVETLRMAKDMRRSSRASDVAYVDAWIQDCKSQ